MSAVDFTSKQLLCVFVSADLFCLKDNFLFLSIPFLKLFSSIFRYLLAVWYPFKRYICPLDIHDFISAANIGPYTFTVLVHSYVPFPGGDIKPVAIKRLISYRYSYQSNTFLCFKTLMFYIVLLFWWSFSILYTIPITCI